MFANVADLEPKYSAKVQTAPGRKGMLLRAVWKLLKSLLIQIAWEIINEEKQRVANEGFLDDLPSWQPKTND